MELKKDMKGHPEHIDGGTSIIRGGEGGRHKWREVAGWGSSQAAFHICSDGKHFSQEAAGGLKLLTYVPSVETALVAVPACLQRLRNKGQL